jgi:hypothetical protein
VAPVGVGGGRVGAGLVMGGCWVGVGWVLGSFSGEYWVSAG